MVDYGRISSISLFLFLVSFFWFPLWIGANKKGWWWKIPFAFIITVFFFLLTEWAAKAEWVETHCPHW